MNMHRRPSPRSSGRRPVLPSRGRGPRARSSEPGRRGTDRYSPVQGAAPAPGPPPLSKYRARPPRPVLRTRSSGHRPVLSRSSRLKGTFALQHRRSRAKPAGETPSSRAFGSWHPGCRWPCLAGARFGGSRLQRLSSVALEFEACRQHPISAASDSRRQRPAATDTPQPAAGPEPPSAAADIRVFNRKAPSGPLPRRHRDVSQGVRLDMRGDGVQYKGGAIRWSMASRMMRALWIASSASSSV